MVEQNAPGGKLSRFLKMGRFLGHSLIIIKCTWGFYLPKFAIWPPPPPQLPPRIRHGRVLVPKSNKMLGHNIFENKSIVKDYQMKHEQSNLRSVIDASPHLLIFRKFSTLDILIPHTPFTLIGLTFAGINFRG